MNLTDLIKIQICTVVFRNDGLIRNDVTNNGKNHHLHSLVALEDDDEDETEIDNDNSHNNDIGSIQRRITRNEREPHRCQIPNGIHDVIDTAGDNGGSIRGYDANSCPNTVILCRFNNGNGHRSIELESLENALERVGVEPEQMKNNYQNNNKRTGRGGEVGIGTSRSSHQTPTTVMRKFCTGSHTPNPMTSLSISKVLQDKHKTDPHANSNNSNSNGSGESLIVLHDAKGAPPTSGTFLATIVTENIQDSNNNNTEQLILHYYKIIVNTKEIHHKLHYHMD